VERGVENAIGPGEDVNQRRDAPTDIAHLSFVIAGLDPAIHSSTGAAARR
jgi:hypothetical protein